MSTLTEKHIEIELHRLELTFQHIRVKKPQAVNQLVASIEQHGQIMPVIVVGNSQQGWILIDGYLRLLALKRLGKDSVTAEVWHCEPAQALSKLLAGQQARAFDGIEEAILLQELQTRYTLSLGEIASRVGRDKSWVCRRLSLLEGLPDKALQAVMQGKLSMWSASRIIVPLARANSEHACQFTSYLLLNPQSTRELKLFYTHYQTSNRHVRRQMVNEPALFFKSCVNNTTKKADCGPEQQWTDILEHCKTQLKNLTQLVPIVFYAEQSDEEKKIFYQALKRCRQLFDELDNNIRRQTDVRAPTAPNHSLPTQGRRKSKCNQSNTQAIT